MAFTASTNNLSLSVLTFTGNIKGTMAGKYVFFCQYLKGDETNAKLSISFIKGAISTTTAFLSSPTDTATVAQQVFTITGTQNVAIPITIPSNATSIVAVLSNTGGTPSGTVVVDGFPDIRNA